MVTTTSRISFTIKELQLVLTTYFPTCSLLIYSLWALVFWSLSFLIRVNVLLDINSWFTIYSSSFPFLISSLWALVFWSLSFLTRVNVVLNINSFPWFTIYSSTFSLLVSGLWALVFWSLVFPYKEERFF